MAAPKRRRRNLDLELTCHACGHEFEQRVGWKIHYVYCPVCNSREVHSYGLEKRTPDKYANGKVIPMTPRPPREAILLVK